jgi:hypothetical protein
MAKKNPAIFLKRPDACIKGWFYALCNHSFFLAFQAVNHGAESSVERFFEVLGLVFYEK